MRKLLFCLVLLAGFAGKAQVFNNEWIDYAKTYYKFRIGQDGLYRINGAALSAAGLGSVNAQEFQLWRNGVQVPVYTSVASGVLGATDYLEFWGKMNDGKPDKELYLDPDNQLSDKWSLISDSATYFLTINTSGTNLRLQTTANNVAGNSLPAEPYFLYTTGKYFRDKVNSGFFFDVSGEHLFSSSYDRGEGWSSADIETKIELNKTPQYGAMAVGFSNLYAATSGPAPTIKLAASGNAYVDRSLRVNISTDSILGDRLPYLSAGTFQSSFSLNLLSGSSTTLTITNLSEGCTLAPCIASDKVAVHKVEMTYPRQFNFGGASNFEFTLPSSVGGSYLEIDNFAAGGTPPVLYDLTNGKRYVGDLAGAVVRFVLDPSSASRELVLVSQVGANVATVSGLEKRSFINYSAPSAQGNYLIISNPLLFTGASGNNPVEDYRAYRSSTLGGSYSAKIYLDDQLVDQFGFGIKKNPAGIRNFIRFARLRFSSPPKHVMLIGRGVHYLHQRSFDASGTPDQKAKLEKLNLVPTFGWPASDMLLAAEKGKAEAEISIGRLTAITPEEVSTYLKKVKETEQAQQTPSPNIADKAWMKNVAHIAGAGEEPLASTLMGNLNSYKRVAEDTLWGANVTTFAKTSTNLVQTLSDADLVKLINEGLSSITYYGHSSATTLEFNLAEPANYTNAGKYPMFFALGCNAGNTFDYNETRFIQRNYLSDKYVLAPDRGSINFIASTHFGIVHYLDTWNFLAYTNISKTMYGSGMGDIMKKTIKDVYGVFGPDDFLARCNAEQTILNGDPAVRMNQQPKPDYFVTDSMLKVSPNFISVADQFFRVNVSMLNFGKAIGKPIVVETKRQYPDGTISVVRRDTIAGIHYRDTLTFNLPIDPTKDKGTNRIFVTVDADNSVDEMFENNNAASRELIIFEDEARTIYPYNYAIVNNRNISLRASTADPFGGSKQYRMEIDTTELFNSPLKVTSTKASNGGIIEFAPGVSFVDGTVYYWRVAPVPANGQPTWSTASFVYLPNSVSGFNQSHLFQHQKSAISKVYLEPGNAWKYHDKVNNLLIRSGVFATAVTQASDFSVSVNGTNVIRSVCNWPSIVVNVFDQTTFAFWFNANVGSEGQYGSDAICGSDRRWNFQFVLNDTSKRRKLLEFLEMIPSGNIVVVRNFGTSDPSSNVFADVLKGDTTTMGSGRSIYHHLRNQGFTSIDSFNRPRAFIFTYKKDKQTEVAPKTLFSEGVYDRIVLSADYVTPDTLGFITSPVFGPASAWKEFKWSGKTVDTTTGDNTKVSIIGYRENGVVDTLFRDITPAQKTVDISSVNASIYRYLQMHMRNGDSAHHTPYQLDYWRLTYDPVPEGGVAPNVLFSMKDTVDVGEPLTLKLAFKNISDGTFQDSMKLKLTIYDRNNTARIIPVAKQKSPKNNGDVMNIQLDVDTKQLAGANTLYLDINPDNDQPEEYHFNNFIFKNFYVRGDTLNPLMDVTFDNVRILNGDIVSAKPNILINLKDEAKWMLLTDPSVTTVQVKYPTANGTLSSNSVVRTFSFASDTLKFNPASGSNNAASIEFKPYFTQDGDYELIVTGKDMSNNNAGAPGVSYHVRFQVINKAMISNMLNYPNPFTTSTAFVFTLTGSEVPQNIRVQIMTVTGKIVREITKNELGPLHIGRNITEFKWDGTDQYGQKLANGVYLYRVITNLNGNRLEKYRDRQDDTDQYFNKGYGKMYLMR